MYIYGAMNLHVAEPDVVVLVSTSSTGYIHKLSRTAIKVAMWPCRPVAGAWSLVRGATWPRAL